MKPPKRKTAGLGSNGGLSETLKFAPDSDESKDVVKIVNDNAEAEAVAIRYGVHRQMTDAAGKTTRKAVVFTAMPSPTVACVLYQGFDREADHGWQAFFAATPGASEKLLRCLPWQMVYSRPLAKGGASWN